MSILSGISGVQVGKKDKDRELNLSFIRPYQVVFCRSTCLETFRQIAQGLLSIELRSCGLESIEFISSCSRLRQLSLPDNNISVVPECIENLKHLELLNLSRNTLADPRDIQSLKGVKSTLVYLNLIGNRLCLLQNYRRNVLSVSSGIAALDQHAISDEELMPSYCHFRDSTKYSPCSKNSLVPENIRTCARYDSEDGLDRALNCMVSALRHIRLLNSPAYIIQRATKNWIRYVRIKKYSMAVTKLQARIRRFIHMRRLHKELKVIMTVTDALLVEEEFENAAEFVTPHAILIQKQWRLYKRRNCEGVCALIIQRWYRRHIVVHRGICLWMKRRRISGLAFASSYVEVVKLFLDVLTRRCSPRVRYEITQGVKRIKPLMLIRAVRSRGTAQKRGQLNTMVCPTGYRADVSISMSRSDVLSEDLEQRSYRSDISSSDQPSEGISSYHAFRRGVHHNPAVALLRAMSFPWMVYASQKEQKQLNNLKARGNRRIVYPKKLSELAVPVALKVASNPFWKRSTRVVVLPIEDYAILWKVFKRLKHITAEGDRENGLVSFSLPLFFDSEVMSESSSIEIQRIWRGHASRKARARLLVREHIKRRAAIALQRWWRCQNFLKRRLALLANITNTCREIRSNIVYMDGWIYYKLMRCFQPPENQSVLHGFPEYGGFPVFNKMGKVGFQPVVRARAIPNRSDIISGTTHSQRKVDDDGRATGKGKDIQVPHVGHLRYCMPQWALWRPYLQLSPLNSMPTGISYHQVLTDLLSINCEVCVVHFPVWATSSTSKEAYIASEMRVIQMIFASIQEAQVRCAMLMLQTYDVKSHSSISLLTKEAVFERIRKNRSAILSGPSMRKADRPHTASSVAIDGTFPPGMCARNVDSKNHKAVAPVETQVILAEPCPQWLLSRNMNSFQNDAVRFRFLCESLSVRNATSVDSQKSPRRRSPVSPRSRHYTAQSSLVVDLASANAGTLIPHADYCVEEVKETISPGLEDLTNIDTSNKQRKISPERARNVGADLLAIRLQPAMPPSHGTTSPRHQRPSSGRVGSRGGGSVDGRLRRHIWSADRVLQWCSNFADDNDGSEITMLQQQLEQQRERVRSAGGERLGSAGSIRVSSGAKKSALKSPRYETHNSLHVRSSDESGKPVLEDEDIGIVASDRMNSAGGGARGTSASAERVGSANRRAQSAGSKRLGSAGDRSELGKAEATAVSRLELIMRSQYENTFDRDFCGVDFIRDMVMEGDDVYVGAKSPVPKPPDPPITQIRQVLHLSKQEQMADFNRERARAVQVAKEQYEQHLMSVQSKVKEVKQELAQSDERVTQWKTNKIETIKKNILLENAELKLNKEAILLQHQLSTTEQVVKVHAERKRKKRMVKSKKNALYVGSILNSMNRHALKNETKHRNAALLEGRKDRVHVARMGTNVKLVASEVTPVAQDEIKLSVDTRNASRPYSQMAHISRLKEREQSRDRTSSDLSQHSLTVSVIRKKSDATGKQHYSSSGMFNSLADYMHASTSRSQFASLPMDGVSLEADLGSNFGSNSGKSVTVDFDVYTPDESAVTMSNRKDITVTKRIDALERLESAEDSAIGSNFDLGSNPSTPAYPKNQIRTPNTMRDKLNKSRTVLK